MYLTKYYFLHVHTLIFITFCWGAFSLYTLIFLWQNLAVSLCAAHKKTELHAAHEALLACYLLSCSTQIITRVQCTKNSLRTVQESWLACSSFHVTHVFWLESWNKLKNTHMFTASECQLRCELYCNWCRPTVHLIYNKIQQVYLFLN